MLFSNSLLNRLYARTNPNYIRRRRRKQLVIERAETQIQHIQEHVVHQLESMPASPQMEDIPSSPSLALLPSLFCLSFL
jgi:hypothetical protein